MDTLNKIDFQITKKIYNLFNNKYLKKIPRYFGLIPYEIYVLPGMYIAILQVIWLNTPTPIQFHLLPHWFAYSIFQFLKKSINRWRPGCKYSQLSKYIDDSHCSHGHELQSFPSGHTSAAFSGASFIHFRYGLKYGIPLYCLASFTGYSRIHANKHHIEDVMAGAGIAILSSWYFTSPYSKNYSFNLYYNQTHKMIRVNIYKTF